MPNLLVTATTRYDPKGLNKAKKHINSFEKSVKSLGKTFAGVFAATKLLQFGKASVRAFVADDKAVRMLGNSLKNIGAAYAATNVEDFVVKLQKTTGVLDDSLRPALQTLLLATGDVTKSQNALALALDISQATGKDLSAVSIALAKGFQGNTTALGKMGGAVSKATLATGDMNKITAELTAKYKGSALTAAAGYSGQMDKLTVASENAKEIIGKGLLNSLSLLGGEGGIGSVTNAIDDLSTGLSEAIVSTGKLIAELKKMPAVGGYLSRVISNPLNLPAGALAFGKGGMIDQFRAAGRSNVKTGYGQQSPGDRNIAVATNKKLQLQKAQELAALMAKNKATKEEAQMKKDQAALDALKAKFDLERIGLNAALNNATDEETKARIRAQIAILDETGKTAQAANDALVKAQADKVEAELKAGAALDYLAKSAGLAATGITQWLSLTEKMKETTGNAGGGVLIGVAATKVVTPANNTGLLGSAGAGGATDSQNTARLVAASISAASANAGLNLGVGPDARYDQMLAEMAKLAAALAAAKTATTVTIVDNTSGLIEIVQDAVISNSRLGNNSTQPGSLIAV